MLFSLFWLLWPILYATGIVSASALAVYDEALLVHIVSIAAGCLLPLRGVWYFVLARRRKTRLRPSMLVQTVLEIILAMVIIFLPSFSYKAFLVFLALYFSFYTAVQGINSFIYGRNRVFQLFFPSLCQAILFSQLFLGVVILPNDIRDSLVVNGSGYLLSMLGHAYLFDWLSVVVKNKKVSEVFRKVSVVMPGFSGLGTPSRLLYTLPSAPTDITPDAEIIFNYGKNGKGIAGHCELCVDGKTYTYGNYDPDSRSILKTVGNGIVFRVDKQRYMQFLLEQQRTVVVYGLKFNAQQHENFLNRISDLEQSLVSWQEKALSAPEEEYIYQMVKQLGADVYHINKGRFKTYFLPTINCVTLTGSLLKGTAAGNIVVPGVYTPGAYMDALHRLYMARNDVVVSVVAYNT